jgi:hypothetical protein
MTGNMLRPDRWPMIARRLGRKPSATADLYLGLACADLIADGRIEQFAPTVFRAGSSLIILRHDAGLNPLPAHERLIWLVDDDFDAGLRDRELPRWYRLRLALLEARAARRLRDAADQIVVPGPAMAEVMTAAGIRSSRLTLLPPAWPAPRMAPRNPCTARPIRVAWLGAASHAGDARHAAEIFRQLLRHSPETEIIWSSNHALPGGLARHPSVSALPAMNWPDYRDWIARARFDIGLYPISSAGFNRGRSANKLGEYAQAGASVLGSEGWQDAYEAARFGACQLLPPVPAAWVDAILELSARPERARALAEANRIWQTQHGFILQRRIWAGLLPDLDIKSDISLQPPSSQV